MVEGGDSGAPVFSTTSSTYQVVARGIVSAVPLYSQDYCPPGVRSDPDHRCFNEFFAADTTEIGDRRSLSLHW
jgi:hypothetical protein